MIRATSWLTAVFGDVVFQSVGFRIPRPITKLQAMHHAVRSPPFLPNLQSLSIELVDDLVTFWTRYRHCSSGGYSAQLELGEVKG